MAERDVSFIVEQASCLSPYALPPRALDYLAKLLDDLQPDGALTRDDIEVVEGTDHRRPPLRRELGRDLFA